MDKTPEQIAAGLEIGDRARLRAAKNSIAATPAFSIQAIERLIDLGFAKPRRRTIHGCTRAHLTAKGNAVRAAILQQEDTNATER